MGSVLFLLLQLPSLYGDNNILGLSRSKVAQIVLQGRKLSSNPFAFYSSPQHCVLLNWLWTCWCASSSCSGDARPYKWVWVWRGGKKRNKLGILHVSRGAALRVMVEWWTTDEEQQIKQLLLCWLLVLTLCLATHRHIKTCFFSSFYFFLSIYCI